jgi:hypothetical protein
MSKILGCDRRKSKALLGKPAVAPKALPVTNTWAAGAIFKSHGTIAMSVGEGTTGGLSVMRGRNYPTIRQFTVFLENRVGQLIEVVRRFEGSPVRIVALSIVDSAECSFVRFLLSHPEQGREILERAGLSIIETDLIGVELPQAPQPMLNVCTALLQAEVNIIQAYPLLVRPRGKPAVALMVDDTDMAMETLTNRGFSLITEGDLSEEAP